MEKKQIDNTYTDEKNIITVKRHFAEERSAGELLRQYIFEEWDRERITTVDRGCKK